MKKLGLLFILAMVLLSGCSQNEVDALKAEVESLKQERIQLIQERVRLNTEHAEKIQELENQNNELSDQLEEALMLKEMAEILGKKTYSTNIEGGLRQVEDLVGFPFILEYQDFTQGRLYFYAQPKTLAVVFHNEREGEALRIETIGTVAILSPQEMKNYKNDENSFHYLKELKKLSNGDTVGLILAVGGLEGLFKPGDEEAINKTLNTFKAK